MLAKISRYTVCFFPMDAVLTLINLTSPTFFLTYLVLTLLVNIPSPMMFANPLLAKLSSPTFSILSHLSTSLSCCFVEPGDGS